ncbi:MAG: TRAP transporter substrate-binding protein DctP [Armatimonadetes bacterium]|nr:TRAP transporter substrate-binding protein DctP [Armatimonadota bacterium]
MIKKNFLLTLLFIFGAASLLLSGCGKGTPAPTQTGGGEAGKTVELKLVSYFPLNNEKEWMATRYFIDKVEQQLAGKVKINVLGGPEVVQTTDQPEALRAGTIDLNLAPGSMYIPLVPEADAIKMSEYSPMEMRKNGAYEFFDQMFQEKANAKYLGQMVAGKEWQYIFLNKKIDKADLSGLLIRTIPIQEPIIKALGGKTVTIPISEIATAMERKVIDGFAYAGIGAYDLNFHEVAKYVIDKGFTASEVVFVMNLNTWNSLPKDVQDAISRIAAEAEEYAWNKGMDLKQKSLNQIKEKGVEFIKLPPAEEEKFDRVISDAGWAEIKKRTPQNYERLRQLLVKPES